MPEKYDLIVIGGGPGGHAAALHAASLGAGVAIIENQGWGGTCTNRGCVPTKALLACSGHYAQLKKIKRLGISAGETSFVFAAMKRHQKQMVTVSALGAEKSLKDVGVTAIRGNAQLLDPYNVKYETSEGNGEILKASKIVIAWGSETSLPPGINISERVLTSDGMLALENLPSSVIIVGGSVIGFEFATFLAELGVKVTVIELLERLLPTEDKEAADMLCKEVQRLGVSLHAATYAREIRETSDGVVMTVNSGGKVEKELAAEYALICTGRKPRLRTEELDRCGIGYGRTGITVDANQMTSAEGVYAVGDVTGGIMLAHRAAHQGKAVADRLFGDGAVAYRDEAVPSVIYTHPQLARVGLTETQAAERGLKVEIIRSEYGANIMARAELQGSGFVKQLFHNNKLIGASIVGDQAGELISSLSLAVAAGMAKRDLKSWIIPHPTLSELLNQD